MRSRDSLARLLPLKRDLEHGSERGEEAGGHHPRALDEQRPHGPRDLAALEGEPVAGAAKCRRAGTGLLEAGGEIGSPSDLTRLRIGLRGEQGVHRALRTKPREATAFSAFQVLWRRPEGFKAGP